MTAPPTHPARSPDHRYLVLGAAGMLGRAWCELLTNEGLRFVAADLAQGDLTVPEDVSRLIAPSFTNVINASGWTDVDGAEKHEDRATRVNGEAVGLLADRCRITGARLTHYSTDYVFDGNAAEPYRVDHPRDPINAYGRSKAAGEVALEHSEATWLCVRTSWLYAPWGNNFVSTISRLASEREELRVVNDQRGSPTSAQRLAATTLGLIENGASGMYHATDGGERRGCGGCTWFEFATRIAVSVNPDCRVLPCTSEEFPRPALRPAYSVLDCSTTETALGPMHPWADALAEVLETLSQTLG